MVGNSPYQKYHRDRFRLRIESRYGTCGRGLPPYSVVVWLLDG